MCGNTYSLWFPKAKLNFDSSLASFSKFCSPAVPCHHNFHTGALILRSSLHFSSNLEKNKCTSQRRCLFGYPNSADCAFFKNTFSLPIVELSLRDYVLIVNPNSASVWCLCFSKNRNRLNWDIKRDISFVTCIYFFQDCLKTWALRPLYRRYSQRWW